MDTQTIKDFFDHLPTGVWVVLVIANMIITAATFPLARRRLHQAGQRAASSDPAGPVTRAKDSALTAASLIPAGLFWTMVLAGSLQGLVAFGRDILGWTGGWEYLVPGTLDGVSVTFAFLAFRAIRKQKAPDRCYRLVWGAALASATVNFTYEYTHSRHNLIAGGYLALLSLLGMAMFHEFLDQFEDGAAYIKRDNPKFGLRWLTWPTNTFCAAVAWRNHPPAEGTPATILNAIANLDRVRELKLTERDVRADQRHVRALDQLRRKNELASAVLVQTPACPVEDDLTDGSVQPGLLDDEPDHPVGGGPPASVRIPVTVATLEQWITTWIHMCDDGDLVHGPLNNDNYARSRFNLSAKQLRNIRHAATTGALRRKADLLGLTLPDAFVDQPTRVDGRQLINSGR